MKDPAEKPTTVEPRQPPPTTTPTTAMQQCLHCKQILTDAEAKAHKRGTDHEVVPYP